MDSIISASAFMTSAMSAVSAKCLTWTGKEVFEDEASTGLKLLLSSL